MSEVFEWIEIDQDFCTRDFGVSPCTATGEKCFNTIKTCKDQPNYNKSVITLRFCENRSILPNNAYYIPTLERAKISGGRLNPIGVGAGSGALGIRAELSVQIKDHPDGDKLVDKYRFERSYIAKENGTFWTKWRARNQYYLGRPIRHCVGDIDYEGNVTNVITRHFFITDFNGPSGGGSVSFEGKDILSQFTDEKAVLPRASTGVLLADITDSATTFTVTPSGIGNLEYPTSGFIRIKKEVMQFTRSGDMFAVVRGQYGSTTDKASANDSVQICVEFYQKTPAEILQTILEDYGNVPTQYLDLAGWNTEKLTYLNRVYSALITEPTGITTLVNEMCEQMFFYLLWDDRNALLKMRAVRPVQGDTVHEFDEDFILADSVDVNDLTEQLITEINVYYGLTNAAEKANEPKNYFGVQTIKNQTEEGVNRNNSSRVKQVFCRFIPRTNSSAAIELGNRYLQRYGTIPRQIQLALKQTNQVKLGDFAKVETRLNVDAFGNKTPLNIQILETAETKTGVILTVKGQEFYSEIPVDPANKPPIIIDLPLVNVNLRSLYDAQYNDPPVSGDEITFTVKSGTVIGSHCFVDGQGNIKDPSYSASIQADESSGAVGDISQEALIKAYPLLRRSASSNGDFYAKGSTFVSGSLNHDLWVRNPNTAVSTGSWPSGVKLKLVVQSGAYIVGQGGFPSIHFSKLGLSSDILFSSDGGDAIKATYPLSIENYGVIGGGGAGGMPLLNQSIIIGASRNRISVKFYRISASGAGAGFYVTNSFSPRYNDSSLSFGTTITQANFTYFDGGTNSITSPSSASKITANYNLRTFLFGNGEKFLIYTSESSSGSGYQLGTSGTSDGLINEQLTRYQFGGDGDMYSYSGFDRGLLPAIQKNYGSAGRLSTGSNLITWLNKGQVYGEEL